MLELTKHSFPVNHYFVLNAFLVSVSTVLNYYYPTMCCMQHSNSSGHIVDASLSYDQLQYLQHFK